MPERADENMVMGSLAPASCLKESQEQLPPLVPPATFP